GDRLAVLPEYRQLWLGGPLVKYAVATAAAAGGTRMIAYVQLTNVSFFRRLGWSKVDAPVAYVGVPHQQMSIDLTCALRASARPRTCPRFSRVTDSCLRSYPTTEPEASRRRTSPLSPQLTSPA